MHSRSAAVSMTALAWLLALAPGPASADAPTAT
jgi:hypothetical protein